MNITGGFEFVCIYFIEILLAFLFSAFFPMTSERKKLYLGVSLGILAIMTMFRGFSVGNDTLQYIYHFEAIKRFTGLGDALSYGRFESGYTAYVWLLSKISSDPQILLIATGLIIYVSLFRFIDRWVDAPGLLIVLYVGTLKFDANLSTMRQALALSIVLFCFDLALNKEPLRFIFFTLLAASFHNVALIFLLVYPLVNAGNRDDGKMHWGLEATLPIVTGVAFVIFQPLLNIVIRYFPVYEYYLNDAYTDGKVRLAVVINIIVCVLLISVPHFVFERSLSPQKKDTAIWRLSLINLCLIVTSLNATLISRVSALFGLFPLVYYNEKLSNTDMYGNKCVMLVLSVALFGLYGFVVTVLKTPEWYTTYPFVWCWK